MSIELAEWKGHIFFKLLQRYFDRRVNKVVVAAPV